jgi:hypothetical protein
MRGAKNETNECIKPIQTIAYALRETKSGMDGKQRVEVQDLSICRQ